MNAMCDICHIIMSRTASLCCYESEDASEMLVFWWIISGNSEWMHCWLLCCLHCHFHVDGHFTV